MPKRKGQTFGKRHISYLQYTYKKKTRDFNTPEYSAWRKKVQARDNKTCQMPGCGSKKKIKVHHIMRWADAPSLRFEVDNGICLCRECHDKVTGYELHWVPLFNSIVQDKKEN